MGPVMTDSVCTGSRCWYLPRCNLQWWVVGSRIFFLRAHFSLC